MVLYNFPFQKKLWGVSISPCLSRALVLDIAISHNMKCALLFFTKRYTNITKKSTSDDQSCISLVTGLRISGRNALILILFLFAVMCCFKQQLKYVIWMQIVLKSRPTLYTWVWMQENSSGKLWSGMQKGEDCSCLMQWSPPLCELSKLYLAL